MTDGKTVDLRKLAKKSHAKAGRGFGSNKSDEVRRDQIVSIEFLFDRTILLGEINGRANGGDQHEIVGIARDPDRNRALVQFGRRWGFSAMHLQYSLLKNSMPALAESDSTAADNAKVRAENWGLVGSRLRSSNCVRPHSRVEHRDRQAPAVAPTDASIHCPVPPSPCHDRRSPRRRWRILCRSDRQAVRSRVASGSFHHE